VELRPAVLRVVRRGQRIDLHAADRVGGRLAAVGRTWAVVVAGLIPVVVMVVGVRVFGHRVFSRSATYTPMGHIAITLWGVYSDRMKRTDKPRLLNRLNRVEGQVRGIARMIEEDRYCIDVLTQIQAVRAALAKVETEMLQDHLGHCIESAIVSGDRDEQRAKAAELIQLLERTR
jgi:DNA-binding FrmR family transcriptional regulator